MKSEPKTPLEMHMHYTTVCDAFLKASRQASRHLGWISPTLHVHRPLALKPVAAPAHVPVAVPRLARRERGAGPRTIIVIATCVLRKIYRQDIGVISILIGKGEKARNGM